MVIPKLISQEEWGEVVRRGDVYWIWVIDRRRGSIKVVNETTRIFPMPDRDEMLHQQDLHGPFKSEEDAKLDAFLYLLTEGFKLLNFEALKPSSPEEVVEVKVPGELLLYLAEQSPEIADKIHQLLLQHGKELKTQEKKLEDTISFLDSTKALTKSIVSAIEIENKFLTNEVASLTSKLESLEADKAELTKRLRLMESVMDSNAKDKNFTFAFMNYLLDENQRLQELLDLKIMST